VGNGTIRSVSSGEGVAKAALIFPFHPIAGFRILHRDASIAVAIMVAVFFSAVYSLARVSSYGLAGKDVLDVIFSFAVVWIESILHFVVLVLISVLLIKGGSARRADVASNTRLVGYWYAWNFSLSAALVVFEQDNFAVQLVLTFAIFAWFACLYAFAMSTANGISLRRGAIYGICALLITAYALSFGWLLLDILSIT